MHVETAAVTHKKDKNTNIHEDGNICCNIIQMLFRTAPNQLKSRQVTLTDVSKNKYSTIKQLPEYADQEIVPYSTETIKLEVLRN